MGATSEMDSAREEWLCYQEQAGVLESGDKEKRQKLANTFDKIWCELKTPQSRNRLHGSRYWSHFCIQI